MTKQAWKFEMHPKETADPELVQRIAEGDTRALGEIYDRYAHDIWRAVRRTLGDASDVEDVVHNLFLKLPSIARTYDGRASCRAWLCGIGVRLALRQRRGAGRFRRMLDGFREVAEHRSTRHPEREAGTAEELDSLQRALAQLADKKRTVFVLVVLEGMACEEVANALQIPAPTVRTRLFHARQELLALLEPSPAADATLQLAPA